jgi:antitoxin component of RelBE/YafQ-DinJ toxin-antitoxin module
MKIKKDSTIRIRVSDAVKEVLRVEAEKKGMDLSKYVRLLLPLPNQQAA